MNKYFTSSFIFCLIVGSLLHFTYAISHKSKWVGYFSAINESIWEHTKLAVFPLFLCSLVLFIMYHGKVNNYFIALPLALLTSTLIIPVLFYFYYSLIHAPIFLFDILIFCISCYLGCKVFFITISYSNFSTPLITTIGLCVTISLFICFFRWTYNPPNFPLFTKTTF